MSAQKTKKLMESDSQESSEEVIQISIKKNTKNIPNPPVQQVKKTKKIQKSQIKPKINQELKKLLQSKIEDEKLLKQLEKGPLNFGEQNNSNNRKILLIEQNVRMQKKERNLGVSLVYQKKALPRKGTNRLSSVLARCDHLRGSMDGVQRIKNNKK